MSSEDTGLENGLDIIDNVHIGVEETDNIFIYRLKDVQGIFKAIIDDAGKCQQMYGELSTVRPSMTCEVRTTLYTTIWQEDWRTSFLINDALWSRWLC